MSGILRLDRIADICPPRSWSATFTPAWNNCRKLMLNLIMSRTNTIQSTSITIHSVPITCWSLNIMDRSRLWISPQGVRQLPSSIAQRNHKNEENPEKIVNSLQYALFDGYPRITKRIYSFLEERVILGQKIFNLTISAPFWLPDNYYPTIKLNCWLCTAPLQAGGARCENSFTCSCTPTQKPICWMSHPKPPEDRRTGTW